MVLDYFDRNINFNDRKYANENRNAIRNNSTDWYFDSTMCACSSSCYRIYRKEIGNIND